MSEVEAIKKMLEIYAGSHTPVTQEFYQELCLKAIEAIEQLQTKFTFAHDMYPAEMKMVENALETVEEMKR